MPGLVPGIQTSARSGARGTVDRGNKPRDDILRRQSSPRGRYVEAVGLEHLRVVRALGRIENFDADDAALIVVVHDDAVRDLLALLDGAVRQVDVDGIGPVIHSHAHGRFLSIVMPEFREAKYPVPRAIHGTLGPGYRLQRIPG